MLFALSADALLIVFDIFKETSACMTVNINTTLRGETKIYHYGMLYIEITMV